MRTNPATARPRALLAALGVIVSLLLGAAPSLAAGPATPAHEAGKDAASAAERLPAGFDLSWVNITPTTSPSPHARESGAMVWDSSAGELLLFGGETNGLPRVYLNDTWTFAGGRWFNRTGGPAPSARLGMTMADDPADGGVVLFGGTSAADSFLNDTWFYAHGTWTNETRTGAPPGRFWGSMSFDNATDSVVMYGGTEASGGPTHYASDMWSYRAGNWTELTPARTPGGLDDQAQVDDWAADELFLFGGDNATIEGSNQSWSYASGTWSPVTSARVPGGRAGAGLSYDAAAGAVVLYGGVPASFDYYATWVYSAGAWTEYNTSYTPPAGTIWGQIAYDPALEEVVMFEGDGYSNATFALNLTSTSPPPGLAVRADAQPISGTVPVTTTFNASASGGTPPYAYAWSFGDAATSTLGNTTHTYEKPGTFIANLTVTDHASGLVRKNWTITVSPGPLSATISADPQAPLTNVSVAFSSIVMGGDPPYVYAWSFGDTGSSTAADPSHAYSKAGTYSVVLIVTDSAKSSLTRNLTIVVTAPGVGNGPGGRHSNNASGSSSFFSGWEGVGVAALVLFLVLVPIVLIYYGRRRRHPQAPPGTPPGNPASPPPPASGPPPGAG